MCTVCGCGQGETKIESDHEHEHRHEDGTVRSHAHDHDGPGSSCATCMHMQAAGNLMKTMSMAVVAAVVFFGCLFGALCHFRPAYQATGLSTLVALKVRLNN